MKKFPARTTALIPFLLALCLLVSASSCAKTSDLSGSSPADQSASLQSGSSLDEEPSSSSDASPEEKVVALELSGCTVLTDGHSIRLRSPSGDETTAVEPPDAQTPVKIISVAPGERLICYIIGTADDNGGLVWRAGLLDVKTAETRAIDGELLYDGMGMECVWSFSGDYLVAAMSDGSALIRASDAQRITVGLGGYWTRLSPDEEKLAYWRRDEGSAPVLCVRDTPDGAEHELAVLPETPYPYLPPMGPFWKGNDTLLYNTGEAEISDGSITLINRILATDISTGETDELFSPDLFSEYGGHPLLCAISDDGRYMLLEFTAENGSLLIYDFETGACTETDFCNHYYTDRDSRYLWDAYRKAFLIPRADRADSFDGTQYCVFSAPDGTMTASEAQY